MKRIVPLQTSSLSIPRAQQVGTMPMQAGTIPAQETGIDLTSLMNMMITMMIVVMMMKMMTGMMSSVK